MDMHRISKIGIMSKERRRASFYSAIPVGGKIVTGVKPLFYSTIFLSIEENIDFAHNWD